MRLPARITGVGAYLPERILTNADLERMVDTDDAWIVERTGIHERHIAADEETTSTMGGEPLDAPSPPPASRRATSTSSSPVPAPRTACSPRSQPSSSTRSARRVPVPSM